MLTNYELRQGGNFMQKFRMTAKQDVQYKVKLIKLNENEKYQRVRVLLTRIHK